MDNYKSLHKYPGRFGHARFLKVALRVSNPLTFEVSAENRCLSSCSICARIFIPLSDVQRQIQVQQILPEFVCDVSRPRPIFAELNAEDISEVKLAIVVLDSKFVKRVISAGFDPATLSVLDSCDNQLHHETNC